jgi:hypothetical protein
VINTPYPALNNGVLLTLENYSKWVIKGTCYLTGLTIDDTSSIVGALGANVSMFVDGEPTDIEPGTYGGEIMLTLTLP